MITDDGTGSYAYGSGKDKLTALSLYGVWQGNRGTYTNVTARYGSFINGSEILWRLSGQS